MLTVIESDHVVPMDSEVLVDAAIRGMVGELDPHSSWMTAAAVHELRADAEGETTGFGVELEVHDGGIRIVRVLPDSPAAREGLLAEDRLLSVDGVPFAGMTVREAAQRMAGERGEIAELQVLRAGWDAPQTIRTQRDVIKEPALEVHRFDDVLYVRFIDFQRGSGLELREAILEERGLTGLVLDLRDNTGGLLDEAVEVVDTFLTDGPIVSVRGRRPEIEVYNATPGAIPGTVDVLVLTNHYSASASEIVAGALQETKRARLVGSPTYGKGSVQQLYRNPDGSALKLTVAQYHLPSGKTIPPHQGLQPDVPVVAHEGLPPSLELLAKLEELALDEDQREELQALVHRLEDPKPKREAIRWSLPPVQRAEEDPVIREALRLLR